MSTLTPSYEEHLAMALRSAAVISTSDPHKHEAVTDRATIAIRTQNITAATQIRVQLYSTGNAEGGYWNLVEDFTLSSTDFPDPLTTGRSMYNEAVTHPILPWTMMRITIIGIPVMCDGNLWIGL